METEMIKTETKKRKKPKMIHWMLVMLFIILGLIGISGNLDVEAASAKKINHWTENTLNIFKNDINGASQVLSQAKGVLVFPRVYQGGFVVGGEYGEGALMMNNKVADYYNIVSGSYGFQMGAQRKAIILAFMNDDALQKFRNSAGWTVGADASVALVALGAEGSIDANTLNKPILAFVVDQKGLMYNLTLEGSKITKIKK